MLPNGADYLRSVWPSSAAFNALSLGLQRRCDAIRLADGLDGRLPLNCSNGALQMSPGAQICSAAAMGSERLMISKGACPSTAATVRGQESVIQKYENALGVPLAWMKRVYDARGNTPCVTYALTATAPCEGSGASLHGLARMFNITLQSCCYRPRMA